MANEATIIERYGHNAAGDVMPFTVSSSVAIPKNSLLVLSASPRTAAIHSAAGQKFVGIASAEKDASDTSTQIGAVTNCVAKLKCTGTVADGDILALSGTANTVEASNALTDFTKIVGYALSDASSNYVPARILK